MASKQPIRSKARAALGEYIRKQREEAGLTQLELSRLLDYTSPQFISNWERGEGQPPIKAIVRASKYLNLNHSKIADLYIAHTEGMIRKAFGSRK
jgi:transcriptional regulator with XRE-family HTH domain